MILNRSLIPKHLNERKISLAHRSENYGFYMIGAFWGFNAILFYGPITFSFKTRVLTHTRRLLSCCVGFLPDAPGKVLFYSF